MRKSRLAPRLVRIEPDVFHAAAGAAERLIGHDVVAARWEQSSVLDGYTVAGLAGHLARAVLTVERYLDAPAPAADSDYTDAAGYFTNVLGTDDPIDSERHRRIRARGAETAADGPEALATELGDARLRLEGRLSPAVVTQSIQARDGGSLSPWANTSRLGWSSSWCTSTIWLSASAATSPRGCPRRRST